MRRAARERRQTVRRWRRHLRLAHPDGADDCACERQPGRFRKGQRVRGCGKARCYVCHGEKLLGEPTPADLRAEARETDGRAELGL